MAWTHDDIPDQSGRVAIVTGANGGIGFETAKALVAAGAHVVFACRNQVKGEAALARVADSGGTAELGSLDLADLGSVRAFAEAFLARHGQLDLLINNAGLSVPPKSFTRDGFELQLGTNHLGHFALTAQLLPCLLDTPGSRVVNVASLAHKTGRIAFDNLDASRGYSRWGGYAQSKLANLLFTRELQRRLTASGHGTLSVAAHPGWAATSIGGTAASRFVNSLFAQPAARGALPTLYAATAPAVEPDGYYGPDGLFELRGDPVAVDRAEHARDDGVARRLWVTSEALTGVEFAV